jgi:hypothetical protein
VTSCTMPHQPPADLTVDQHLNLISYLQPQNKGCMPLEPL